MGTASSEPCIYDRLSESIEVLRQSGYRYGMSESEIERFIRQVLETNEPQRTPPPPPSPYGALRTLLKGVVALVVLLGALLLLYPQSPPQLSFSLASNWSSPLSYARLLPLPIAKKYHLQGFHEWWSSGALRQPQVNCSVCAHISSVMEVPESLRGSAHLRRGPQLVLIKGGAALSVQRQQLEELYLSHSASISILLEDSGYHGNQRGLPQGPANYTLLWRFSSGTREKLLRWLFPKAELCPLLDSAGTALQRCLVTHSTHSHTKGVVVLGWLVVGEGLPTVRVLPVPPCQKLCSSFNLWLTAGDMVYADPRYWHMELFPGRGQNIVCDGSAF